MHDSFRTDPDVSFYEEQHLQASLIRRILQLLRVRRSNKHDRLRPERHHRIQRPSFEPKKRHPAHRRRQEAALDNQLELRRPKAARLQVPVAIRVGQAVRQRGEVA